MMTSTPEICQYNWRWDVGLPTLTATIFLHFPLQILLLSKKTAGNVHRRNVEALVSTATITYWLFMRLLFFSPHAVFR